MTGQEQTLFKFDDLLKDIGLNYMIFASTLLHIIREGKLYEPDTELDFAFHGEDLTDEIMGKLKASGYYGVMYPCNEKYGEFYLWNKVGETVDRPHIAMNPVWNKEGIVYQNMNADECMLWDPKYYPKKTWSTINYLGRDFKTPSKPKKWLKYWYGADWKTPLTCSWRDNKNKRQYKELWI